MSASMLRFAPNGNDKWTVSRGEQAIAEVTKSVNGLDLAPSGSISPAELDGIRLYMDGVETHSERLRRLR